MNTQLPADLRQWSREDLLHAVRAAGIYWDDRHEDNLTEGEVTLLAAASRSYLTAGNEPQCPGTGRAWGSGTGTPICPACHLGPAGLSVKRPVRRLGRWTGQVPAHAQRTR